MGSSYNCNLKFGTGYQRGCELGKTIILIVYVRTISPVWLNYRFEYFNQLPLFAEDRFLKLNI